MKSPSQTMENNEYEMSLASHVADEEVKPVARSGSNFRRITIKLWLEEWTAWVIALAAMIATAAVLAKHDNQPVPDWPFGITLGALVSLLATIATIGISQPLAAGIGQARWLWLRKSRAMTDFDAVDNASRGPFGSLWLIIRARGGPFAIIGALLLILSQAIGPFAQQVVHYESRSTSQAAAAVPIAQLYNTRDTDGRDASLGMKAAMQRGMLDTTANLSTYFVSPNCPTGNCTWEPYSTFTLCSRCTDLRDQITMEEGGEGFENVTLPNGMSVSYVPSTTNHGKIQMQSNVTGVTNQGPGPDSIAYETWHWPVLDVITLVAPYSNPTESSLSGIPKNGPYASECIVQFCVRSLTSQSTNGVYEERAINDPVYLNYTYYYGESVEVGGLNYSLDYYTWQALTWYIEPFFSILTKQSMGLSTSPEWLDSAASQSLFYWINKTEDHMPTQMFENMAASMGLHVRSTSNLSSEGLSWSTNSVIVVRWPWMALPFASLVFVGIWLAGIAWFTSAQQIPPWKTSDLAVLMHGFGDEESRSLAAGAETLDQMERLAEKLQIRVVKSTAVSSSESTAYQRVPHTTIVAM